MVHSSPLPDPEIHSSSDNPAKRRNRSFIISPDLERGLAEGITLDSILRLDPPHIKRIFFETR